MLANSYNGIYLEKMKAKFNKDDIVVDRLDNHGVVIEVKWSCCSDNRYIVRLRSGKTVPYYEHDLRLMIEFKGD